MIDLLARRLRDLPIRYKFLFSTSVVFTLFLALGVAVTYSVVRRTLEHNIERELKNSSTAILNLVRTSVTGSIRSYLRAVADRNVELVEHTYGRYLAGELSETEARRQAEALILSQKIGQTGYVCCLDSHGVVVVHPQEELLQKNLSEHRFVQELMNRRSGYQEYEWRNPDEAEPQAKAMYMAYFAPWDWVITVVSYRGEFGQLVNVDDLRASVLDLKFGESGYAYVLDADGRVLIHPLMEGTRVNDDASRNAFFDVMRTQESGKVRYWWRNPEEPRPREKLVIFDRIPEFDWIFASSSYLDEVYAPLRRMRLWFGATVGVSLLLTLLLTFRLSATVTRPIQQLTEGLSRGATGAFGLRLAVRSGDEVGRLATYFNGFMEQLGAYSDNLQAEIAERRRVEAALRESEERYRSVMEAAPDPVAVYDMEGQVIYLNPAFSKLFGWTLQESQGCRMDHFVPDECWPETRAGIAHIISGRTISGVRTRRRTRSGELRDISISGAPFRDRDGNLAGSVMILHDVTARVRAENALALSEETFSKAFRLSPSGMVLVSLDDRCCLDANDALLGLLGEPRERVLGQTLEELGLFAEPAAVPAVLEALRATGQLRGYEVELSPRLGERRRGRVSAECLEIRRHPCLLATIEDITEARRLERQVVEVGDQERHKLGRELHDDLGPHLIGIEVLSKVLENRLADGRPEQFAAAAASAGKIRTLIAEAIEKARSLARGLGTVHLSAKGLDLALRELAANTTAMYGVPCEFFCGEPVTAGDDAVATQLYYIAREAVNNAVRHAGARQITVKLCQQQGAVRLRVADDGIGMPKPPPDHGLGLRIMGFRARTIDATLELVTHPGAGTAWTVTRPLAPEVA